MTWGWVLAAPGTLLILVLLAYPLLAILLRSFHPGGRLNFADPSFTLANYVAIVQDPASLIILRNTFIAAGVSAVVSLVAAYPVAVYLSQVSQRAARLVLLVVVFSFWTSVVVRMYSLQLILGEIQLLYSQTAVIIGMASYLIPFLILILYGAMVRIDTTLLTAARTLGASPVQAMRTIFFPLSRPAVLAGTLLVFVIGLGFFVTPALLGGTADMTVAMYIAQQVRIDRWGRASAMGIGLLVVAIFAYYVFDRVFGVEQLSGSSRGPAHIRTAASLSTVSWASSRIRRTLGIWTAVVVACLVVPLIYVVVISFSPKSYLSFPPSGLSTRWYAELFGEAEWFKAAALSLRVALLATALATVVGLSTAVAMTRTPLLKTRFFRGILILPIIVPIILIAIGVYELVLRSGLSGSLWGFALPHALLALPFAVLIINAALDQVGPSLEEVARTLGAGRLRAFVSTTLRLIIPSVVAAALIAFVTSWDEVVIALFVQFVQPTLPVRIYTFVRESLRPTVAAVSTLVLGGLLSFSLIGARVRRGWLARK